MRHCARWNQNDNGDKNGCKTKEVTEFGVTVATKVNVNQNIMFQYQTFLVNENSIPI